MPSNRTLCSTFGVVTTTVSGLAWPNTARSNAPSRDGSTCSMTSIETAASNPSSRASRYVNDDWNRVIRERSRSDIRSSFSLRVATSSARHETSLPTISMKLRSSSSTRSSAPSPHPRSRTRRAPSARNTDSTVPLRCSASGTGFSPGSATSIVTCAASVALSICSSVASSISASRLTAVLDELACGGQGSGG